MKEKDIASTRYLWGLIGITVMELIMTHGIYGAESGTDGQLVADGTDFSPWISLIGSASRGVVSFVSEVSASFFGMLAAAAVMLLLRMIFRDPFLRETAKRDLKMTGIAALVCYAGCLVFSGFSDLFGAVMMLLPVYAAAWITYHAGRVPADPEENDRQISEDLCC